MSCFFQTLLINCCSVFNIIVLFIMLLLVSFVFSFLFALFQNDCIQSFFTEPLENVVLHLRTPHEHINIRVLL